MLKGLRLALETYSKMPSAENCPNKTLIADHAAWQLVMMSRRIESVRKSIFHNVSLATNFTPESVFSDRFYCKNTKTARMYFTAC